MKKQLKLLAAVSALLATAGAFAADDMTAIKLQIFNAKGHQTFGETLVTKGEASFGEQYGYPVAVS